MKQKIFFHGTRKDFIKEIFKKGLVTKYGRATLTTNPKYSISFSSASTRGAINKIEDYPATIRVGALMVFKIPQNQVRIAKNSNIILKKKDKIITGWPNRYKTQQYGYYPLDKTKKVYCR